VKVLDVTEFYSERGGGVRSHLTSKGKLSWELGHTHVVVAPGPRDLDEPLCDGRPSECRGGAAPRVVRIAGPSLPYDPTYHLLWRVDKVRSRVEEERPDVLEIDSPYAAAAACLTVPRRHFGVRTFVWHSDFIDTYLRVLLEERAGLREPATTLALEPLWGGVRWLASKCDATFVAARWIEEKLLGHGVARVVRLPFGVERAAFTPAARSESVRQRLLGGRVDGTLLVGVGRFAVEKRWDVVLDAVDAVRRETPLVLALFGDGPERGAIEARARTMGSGVRVLGFEKDRATLASALASADLLVHGCPYETFGFAVAEAMSSGLPVVVPDAGGAGELAGETYAERYVPGDAASCADALRRMLARVALAGARRAIGEQAVRAAERLPTVRGQFEATYEAYARLLRDRGASPARGLSFRE